MNRARLRWKKHRLPSRQIRTPTVTGKDLLQSLFPFRGFVYGEDETALTTLPTVTCEGGDRPHAGTHTLILSGGEAQDYEFVYEPGTLMVEKSTAYRHGRYVHQPLRGRICFQSLFL